jgi:hypothetical protein
MFTNEQIVPDERGSPDDGKKPIRTGSIKLLVY